MYSFLGPAGEAVVQSALFSPSMITRAIQGFADIGMDELVFLPCVADLDQVDRLTELVA